MKWPKWLRRAGSWLRRNWCIVSVPVTAVLGILLSVCFWEELHGQGSVSETIRNLGLVIGGVIAIQLAIWRSKVAERQADTAQQGLLNERYQKGAEMLGSSVPAVRLGGIYALQGLTKEHREQYHVQIMRLLCAFVRHPTEDKNDTSKLEDPLAELQESRSWLHTPHSDPNRQDVHAVMKAIGARSEDDIELERKEDFRPDLTGVDLPTAFLPNANFSHINLSRATFSLSTKGQIKKPGGMERDVAHLEDVDLTSATLHKVNLINAELTNAILTGAELTGADLYIASLEGAELTGADLTGADLTGANLTGANLSHVQGLTQAQLDPACADSGKPPTLMGSLDAKTGDPLVWRDKPCEDA